MSVLWVTEKKKNPQQKQPKLFLFTTIKEWGFIQSCAVAVLSSPVSAIQFILL